MNATSRGAAAVVGGVQIRLEFEIEIGFFLGRGLGYTFSISRTIFFHNFLPPSKI